MAADAATDNDNVVVKVVHRQLYIHVCVCVCACSCVINVCVWKIHENVVVDVHHKLYTNK